MQDVNEGVMNISGGVSGRPYDDWVPHSASHRRITSPSPGTSPVVSPQVVSGFARRCQSGSKPGASERTSTAHATHPASRLRQVNGALTNA